MKRRLTALALALGLTFTLAACGGTAGTANTPGGNSESPAGNSETPAAESDMAYVKEKGTLIVGMTDFAPMDYKDENGEWIGFDADMAKLVAEKLGVEIEFIVIDWNNKIMELDSKNIDVVWNGMTLTDEVTSSMECTNPYVNNAQVVVTKAQ